MFDYSEYPRHVVEDIARLRHCIQESGLPVKRLDHNLLIGTWNIRQFSNVFPSWMENPGSPKRNWRAMAYLVETIRQLDVIAIQEVKRDTSGLRMLLNALGPDWSVILTDVVIGDEGNAERLAFIYDRRRLEPSGLAGEIVLPPTPQGDPARQFARSPFMVGFRCAEERFILLSAHIKYGKVPADRIEELRNLSTFIAKEIRDRSRGSPSEEANLIVLGDFNIDERGDNPLFQAFISTGLVVPPQLEKLRSATGSKPKYYDQIAWFMGDMEMNFNSAGVIDFAGAVYPEIAVQQMTYRVSDHFPLWAEFIIDRSEEKMARVLGVDPGIPDPLSMVINDT